MIFITVGTHEQPFDRLVMEMDRLIAEKKIEEEVFMQIGYGVYEPKHAEWSRLVPFEKMKELERTADVVITHGGPATFMSVLSKGKNPIVVPRQKAFGEHVNDHQLDFAYKVLNKGYDLRVVEHISELEEAIIQTKKRTLSKTQVFNNERFNTNFKFTVKALIEERSYIASEKGEHLEKNHAG